MEFEENFVEAIEEGKIVRVSESYARSEGLPILRRHKAEEVKPVENYSDIKSERSSRIRSELGVLDNYGRQKDWRKEQVLGELVDNFHWQIRVGRRRKNLTRKQFAQEIGEDESAIKALEAGQFPFHDFVLVNKVQKALGLNLRKDGKDFDMSVKDLMSRNSKGQRVESGRLRHEMIEDEITGMTGSEIEILEDEF